jgi:hypothetical protein
VQRQQETDGDLELDIARELKEKIDKTRRRSAGASRKDESNGKDEDEDEEEYEEDYEDNMEDKIEVYDDRGQVVGVFTVAEFEKLRAAGKI